MEGLSTISSQTQYDPALAERMSNVFKQTLGAQNVTEVPPVMAGEDFSRYGRTDEQIPVFLYWLGTVSPENIAARDNDGKTLSGLHSASFAPDYPTTIRLIRCIVTI